MKTYEPQGDPADADCVIGNSFGTSTGEGSVNQQLAAVMQHYADGRPLIADRTLADAYPDGDNHMSYIVEGSVTNMKVQGVGTWGTLVAAQRYMEHEGLSHPLMIAQAYHIGRVARQATKLGIQSIVPEDLPDEFDKQSEQIWTRSAYLWIPFNAIGSILLKKRGQL